MQLPSDLQESLSEHEFSLVEEWWASLTLEQQLDYSDASEMRPEDFATLPDLDDLDPELEMLPFCEYLTNHELRLVNFVDESTVRSSYRIVSSYVASLGSDYRHGKRGTVG